MKNKHFNNRKAFSLVEISVVILIVGILIFGISRGNNLYNDFRLRSAQNLTLGAPLNTIRNAVLWYETSLPQSFLAGENRDGVDITRWNDISNNSNKNHAYAGQKTNANGISFNLAPASTIANTKGPIYIADGINNLPTLQFRNVSNSEYRYLVSDINSRTRGNEDLLMIVVTKYNSGSGWLIDRQCTVSGIPLSGCPNTSGSTPVGTPLFGIETKNARDILFDCRYEDDNGCVSGNYYFDTGYDFDKSPTILTIQRKFNNSVTMFYNGKNTLGTANRADNSKNIPTQPIKIGRHVNFEHTSDFLISEIIFIAGTISDRERDSIEDYLGKKYSIPVSH